jgi:hypothetical protein
MHALLKHFFLTEAQLFDALETWHPDSYLVCLREHAIPGHGIIQIIELKGFRSKYVPHSIKQISANEY